MATVHYQKRDQIAFDYMTYLRSGFPIAFRGPRVPVHLFCRYAVALGSAATFGRFVHQPYAEQLTLGGLPTLNLGISGARPDFFARIPDAAHLLGNATTVIFEIVSARGYATSFYKPSSQFSNIGTYTAPDGEQDVSTFVDQAWKMAIDDYPRDIVEAAVEASLERYVEDFKDLCRIFPRNVILLWLSQRPYNKPLEGSEFEARSGRFPHFIKAETIERLRLVLLEGGHCASLVDITSSEGLPAAVVDRTTGRPVSIISPPGTPSFNTYYPSQEMHDAAAIALWQTLGCVDRVDCQVA